MQKKIIENRDTSQNTKHSSDPICIYQRETILNTDKFDIDSRACFKGVVNFVCVLVQHVHDNF